MSAPNDPPHGAPANAAEGGAKDGAEQPLFREEAVRDYVQGHVRGRILRVSPRWARWVEPLLLATLAGAGLFVGIARVDRVVSGPAIVRRVLDADAAARSAAPSAAAPSAAAPSLEVVALLRGRDRPLVGGGEPLRVRFEGGASPELAAPTISEDIVGPERARALLGADAAGLVEIDGPTFLVRAALPAGDPSTAALVPGSTGRAEILVGRRRLVDELLPEGRP